jgi:hypothetical protein
LFLPPHVQTEVQTTFADLLATGLKGKVSSLTSSHALIARFVKESSNGYWLLYELAIHAGLHPLLDDCPSLPREPHQKSDMSLSDYVSSWRRYLHYAVLSGRFLSDCFFYHQFIRFMDPFVRSLIESRLDHALRDFPLGTALPIGFDPDRMLSKLTRYATYAGRPDIMETSPRDLARRSAPVHALSTSTPVPPDSPDNDLLLAALQAGSSCACFICDSVDHLVADCPLLQKMRSNNTSRRLLSRLLQSRGRPRSSPPLSTAAVHQVVSTAGEGTIDAGEGSTSLAGGNDVDGIASISPTASVDFNDSDTQDFP